MKKFLAVLLVIALCVSTLFTLVACGGPSEPEGPTLEQAFEYFKSVYKDDENKKTQKDYNLVAKVQIEGVSFDVSYTVDTDKITINLDEKTGFYVVDLPDENAEEFTYTITATVKDADGNTSQYTMKRILAVYEAGIAGVVTEPVANTAYKLFMDQKSIGKVLFITAEASSGKYLNTNIDPKAAPDWYVEVVEGGYKIYTVVSDVKMYMLATASPRAGEEGKFDKVIALSADNASVFKYKADINAWYTTINTSTTDVANNIDFAMGTYSTYETLCISEASYYTAENTGVEQFPLQFITKEAGEAMKPTDGPADPTELTSIADVIAIGEAKDHNTYTVEKYLVEGVITNIVNSTYGNLYIEDENGNSVYIYGLYSADGQTRFDKLENKPMVGDTIRVMSIVGQYNGTVQLKNAWLISKTDKVWTDAEKVAYEKDNLDVIKTINVAGETVLPIAGTTHSDVVVSWEIVGTTALATMTDGKTVVVAALPTEAGTITVKATFTLGGETDTQEFNITISAPATLTISEAAEMGTAKEHNTYTVEKYFVEGVITNITSTTYGNMYIDDGAGNSILIYGLYSADGSLRYDALAEKPQVGDTIKVLSVVGQYNGTAQLKNAWLITLTKGENPDPTPDPEPADVESIADIIAGTAGTHKAQGVVIAINAKSFLLKDDTGIILVFMNKAPEVAVGDTLTLTGPTSTYGGMVQFGSDSTWTKGSATTVTHPTPIVLDAAGVDGYSTNLKADYVQITGTLTVSGNYFNLTVDGATLVGSLTYLPDDLKTAATVLDGSAVVVKGYVTGIAGSGKYLNLMVTEIAAAEGGDPTPDPDPTPVEVTLAEAVELEDGTLVIVSGAVCKINYAWSDSNGNMSITITDGTNELYVYKLTSQVALGDLVTITGAVGSYNGAKQIAEGATATIDGQHSCDDFYAPATCTEPATCKVCGATSGEALGHGTADEDGNCPVYGENVSAATSSMNIAASAGTLNGDSTAISWENDIFTFTNEKTANSSPITVDYTDHHRLYKNSNMVITAKSGTISKVVITTTGSTYASALVTSLNAVEGYTAVADGNIVTLTLATPATEISCNMSANQTRVSNVVITYVAE